MKSKLLIGLIISAVMLTGMYTLNAYAGAQKNQRQARMAECFAEQDSDNNGTLSLNEFTAMEPRRGGPHTTELFAAIDQNGDQQLTEAELSQAREEHRARMRQHFTDADSNSDGKLSKDEFLQMQPPRGRHNPEDRFDEWDQNGDGILQSSELPEPPCRDGRGQGKSRPRMPRGDRFERADTNDDGNVTKDEFLETRNRFREEHKEDMFTRMDENGDGFLDEDEMRPPHPSGHGRHGRGDCEFGRGMNGGKRFSDDQQIESNESAGYRLIGNSPNPFNSSTTISYEIPEAAQVMLKVYNINGQEVATLVNELQGANRYDVKFNISDLTSGVYFYHLQAGDFSAINRMLYIK
ncbi:T9SS type A sorting domain-containing protein [bacterium]|nr:T9SS type A sorting domain-containing protein [bacterium]